MKKASVPGLFASFLREKAGTVFLCAAVALLFLAVGALSRLDMGPLLYALLLSGLLAAVAAVASFSRYAKRFRQAEAGQNHLETLPQGLPAPGGRLEKQYQALVKGQAEMRLAEKNEQTRRLKEREDYYTLWMHQIKTPIAAMRLLLQSGEPLPAGPLEEELFKIERYAEMALTYLRLESQADDLELKEYDLYGLVKKAVKKYALLFIHKKIALELEPFQVRVMTDEKWFLVLLEQILSNAVKYTEKGAVRIYVKDGVALAVQDSGAGIPKEDLPRVFDRGFTGHNGRVDQRATGIGLYLAKEAAKKLGHTVSIQSEPDRGTTVTIGIARLPLEIF